MSQNINTGLTSVTGNVTTVLSAGTPATQLKYVGKPDTASGTLATVGANKAWYIVGVNMSLSSSSANINNAAVLANGVGILNTGLAELTAVGGDSSCVAVMAPFGCYLAYITAGQTVTYTLSTGCYANVGVWYIEVSV